MGAFEKILGLGGAALALYGISAIRKDNKEQAKREAEEERRRKTPFKYPENIPYDRFKEIVLFSIKPMKKKLRNIDLGDGKIYGTVISQSGITEWSFTIDFNDYGKLTGEYWITTENYDSLIPKRIAETVQSKIFEITS